MEKTVVEGAGAAGLAAVLRYPERFRNRRVGLPLCGGNIDMMILSSLLQRGLVRSHRLVRIRVEIEDVPGALGKLTQLLGELDSNIIDIAHQRTFGGSSVRAAVVDLTLQMRGEEQEDKVVSALKDARSRRASRRWRRQWLKRRCNATSMRRRSRRTPVA